MKRAKVTRVLLGLLLHVAFIAQGLAYDFRTLSDDELSELRGQLQELAPDEREQLLDEMQRRLEPKPTEQNLQADAPKESGRPQSGPSVGRSNGTGYDTGPGNDPGVRQIHRYGEAPRRYGQPPPAYGQGPSGGIGRGIPRR